MFSRLVQEEIKNHAVSEYPDESCGLVVNDTYLPCRNIAADPVSDFLIDPMDYCGIKSKGDIIQAVVHSHTNGKDFPSKNDMISQVKMDIPWGIITVNKDKSVGDLFWFGDQVPIRPFIGRKFRHGVSDCYALVRDWFRQTYGIYMSNYPRSNEWWNNGEDMFNQLFADAGCYEIHRPERIGDILVGRILGKVPNHCAVYLGDGRLLHHLSNRLSNSEPADRWMKFIMRVFRHKDMPDA